MNTVPVCVWEGSEKETAYLLINLRTGVTDYSCFTNNWFETNLKRGRRSKT